jgi:dTDP-L-rhamnose 4-epimerase
MNVLVTGGAGFIGSHVVDLLVARRNRVTVLDNLDPQVHGPGATEPRHLLPHLKNGSVAFLRGDVTDPARVVEALDGVEAVVHLAAAVGVGQSMYEPKYYTHTNGCGTGVLLECLVPLRAQVRNLVVASSMSLYGEGSYACPSCGGRAPAARELRQLEAGSWETRCAACGSEMEPRPTPETKPPVIASIYAATKRHQEDLAVAFGDAYRIPTFALRFFNVFGPRQSLANPYTGVAAIFLSRLLNGRPPLIFEDGQQSRDFVDVRDVAQAIVLALDSRHEGTHVLNVGTGRRLAVGAIAQMLATHLGSNVNAQLLRQFRAGDIRHCFADTSKAKEVLGFQACRTLEEGLPTLVEWCRNERPPDGVERSHDELRRQGLVK